VDPSNEQLELLRKSVDEFELRTRARNALWKDNIRTVGQLIQKSECELLCIPNCGRKTVAEIKELVQSPGLELGVELPAEIAGGEL
jgi:DNA-directed RNA polymerase subunit alpha